MIDLRARDNDRFKDSAAQHLHGKYNLSSMPGTEKKNKNIR